MKTAFFVAFAIATLILLALAIYWSRPEWARRPWGIDRSMRNVLSDLEALLTVLIGGLTLILLGLSTGGLWLLFR